MNEKLHKVFGRYLDKSAVKYGLVGIINTLVGYGIMFGLTFLQVMPELANACSYGIAFLLSYILNKNFTFEIKGAHKKHFSRFVIASTLAYIANLIVLIICHRIFLWNEYIALILASIVYVIVGYILHKFWTFG